MAVKTLYDMALAGAPVKSHYQVTLFTFSVHAFYMWLSLHVSQIALFVW